MGKLDLNNIHRSAEQTSKLTYSLKLLPHLQTIRCDKIRFHPQNRFARHDDDAAVQELADSIRVNGLISPIAVNDRGGGVYRLLSGERRFKAVCLEEISTIECNVYDHLDDATELRILYAANLDVRKYSNAEILDFYKELYNIIKKQLESGEYQGGINDEISKIMNISSRQVRKYALICDELTEEEQQSIADKKLSINSAAKIASQRAAAKSVELVPPKSSDDDNVEPVPPKSTKSNNVESVPLNSTNSDNVEPVPQKLLIEQQFDKTMQDILTLMDLMKGHDETEAYQDLVKLQGKLMWHMQRMGFRSNMS